MPRKPTKTKEEKTAEDFFEVDADDLRYAIEKAEKDPSSNPISFRSTVEKEYKGPSSIILDTVEREPKERRASTKRKTPFRKPTKRAPRKTPRKTAKKAPTKEYKQPKISLKKGGYELIITEKPQAAMKIAAALGADTKRMNVKVPYYEVDRNGKEIVVACAVGHLFTLKQNSPGSGVPVFDISWVPNYLVRKVDFTKQYYDTILRLVKNASEITVATDYDIEGEVIGRNVVKFLCNQPDAARMKFSTLTTKELNDAYEKKSKTINWNHALAGEARHYLDWFYGINLSRALMNAIKTTGKFKIMSIGRVQGPALELIVNKEREIGKFKSSKYWQVFITVKNSHVVELKHNKDITKKSELPKFEKLKGKTAIAETKKSQQIIPPNPPFNLTSLQTEAYKFHGITPSQTLRAAQSLYLGGLISYPRTSSEKLPAEVGYKEILEKLAKLHKVEHLIKKSKPIEGKKSDPAHPSIYPTGNTQILSGDEEKIYNLIVKRFLSLFCEDAIIDNKTIRAEVDKLVFSARGGEIKKKAWMEIYPTKINEKELPDVEGEVKIINVKNEEKETQPPKRFSPASIVSELEKRNLGTKATRASILETLYDRGYVQDKAIKATPLGISLIETLEKHSPIIIDEKLTRHFETEMEEIQKTKLKSKMEEKRDEIIAEAKKTITKIIKDFEKSEKQIGQELIMANENLREQQREENTLNQCPKCKKGNLVITYSKKTRRHFIGCTNYPECKNTSSLPPNGAIKKAGKDCEECKFPMLMTLRRGKRPWIFCFNPECPTNKERIEEYRKRKEAEENEK